MISRLTGDVVYTDTRYIVLDVHGVGYKVFLTGETIHKLTTHNKDLMLYTYTAIRENAMDLYGFITKHDLDIFELLITVSGIGPKTALGVMNSATADTIETAVQTGDTSHLTKVSGVGKKVAEKIVMELKDKMEKIAHTPESKSAMRNDSDALEALKALGYSQNEARDALKELPKDVVKTNDKVRAALKVLGK